MKKQILKSFLVLAIIAAASSAMAATTIQGQVTLGSGSYSPSTKVGLLVSSTAVAYAATAAHLTGTKQYGTVAGSGVTGDPSKIYVKDNITQSGDCGLPSAPASATSLGSGWQ